MKYLILIAVLILVSVIGYFAGQYFYNEKISSNNQTQSNPLIHPLIEEKKYTTIENLTPSILVPQIKQHNNSKDQSKNQPKNQETNQQTNQETNQKENQEPKETNQETNQETSQETNQETNQETSQETSQQINPKITKQNQEINQEINEKTTFKESQNGSYYIQLGSYSTIENAENIKSQLEQIGLQPKIEKIIKNEIIIYRVIIGPYNSEEEANQESIKLKKLGFDNIVKTY